LLTAAAGDVSDDDDADEGAGVAAEGVVGVAGSSDCGRLCMAVVKGSL
jgi:hypothetical protein